MALFLFRFWPVLIPLIVYLLWHHHMRKKARKAGEPEPRFRDGPWFWAVLASLLIGMVCFLVLGLSAERRTGNYIPPHMENGVLVPGRVSDGN